MTPALLITTPEDHTSLDPGFALLHSCFHQSSVRGSNQTHVNTPAPNLKFMDSIDVSCVPTAIEACIHDQISSQSQSYPNKEALISEVERLTYHELDRFSTALARHLQDVGTKSGDHVGFCFEKSIWAVVSMLGILKMGGSCVPIDPSHPPSRTGGIINAASLHVVIVECHNDLLDQFPVVNQICVTRDLFTLSLARQIDPTALTPESHSCPSDRAFLLFTSGSTGTPKAVILTHSAICSSAEYHGRSMFIGPETRVYQHAAYTFDMSIYDIFTTLIAGGTVCVPSSHARIHRIAESIQKLRANWAFFTPSLLSTLHPTEVPSLRTVLLAGEPVTQEIIDTWSTDIRLLNGYGSTEMSTCFLAHLTRRSNPKCIGIPKGVIARIVEPEDHGKIVTSGSGELIVIGPVLASGYLNDNERTEASFSTSTTLGYRTYRTGDIVEQIADGSYRFLGRQDTMIKIRGLRVELGEIEYHLVTHPAVSHAIVVFPNKGSYNEKLTAVVCTESNYLENVSLVGEKGSRSSLEHVLASHLEKNVPHYMIPHSWVFVECMKMTDSGKIDRRAITALIEDEDNTHVTIPNKSQTLSPQYTTIREPTPLLVEPSLLPSSIPGHNNDYPPLHGVSFLDLGLDSINLIGLAKILKKAYNLDLDIATLGLLSLQKLFSSICARMTDEVPEQEFRRLVQPRLSRHFDDLLEQMSTLGLPTESSVLSTRVSQQNVLEQPLNVLVTGATGFVGPQILKSLFSSLPLHSKVIAIVRASTPSHGFQRLLDSFERAGIQLPPDQLERLEVWPGDLTQPDFHLAPTQRNDSRRNTLNIEVDVDVVIHNGAVVNWTMAYEALKTANVSSTITLLKSLSGRLRPAKMIYVSGGRALEIATNSNIRPSFNQSLHNRNSVQELNTIENLRNMLDVVQDSDLSLVGYDISKLLSESLVKAASETNALETHVIRPGYIIGDSNTGYVNAEDYIWRVVATAIRLRKRCNEPASSFLYLAGVDQVAKQIIGPVLCLLNRNDRVPCCDSGEVNITAGLAIYDFWAIVSSVFGINIDPLPHSDWLSAVEHSMAGAEPDKQPLYPILDAHKQDGGMLGIECETECSSEMVVMCLEMSLTYLGKSSELFRSWAGLATL